jgi:hypothetical protein
VRVLFIAAAALVAALSLCSPIPAQTEKETEAWVPELSAFHEVIYAMWHNAYPAQDTTSLREMWPDVQKHVDTVSKADLPGILRDKKAEWGQGIENLRAMERAYGDAVAPGRGKDLLAAAENLHAAFERLVRTIRPVLPEIDEFHQVLYRIYHYDLPAKDIAALRARIPALTAEMDTLAAAALPKRWEKAQAEFEKARADLGAKVKALARTAKQEGWEPVQKAVEEMHTAYQKLERVFD